MPRKSAKKNDLPVSPFERMGKEKKLDWITIKWKEHLKGKRSQAGEKNLEAFLNTLEVFNPSKPKGWNGLKKLINLAISSYQRKPLLPACGLKLKAWTKQKMKAQSEESLSEPAQAKGFSESQLIPFWKELWASKIKRSKQAAVISAVCFYTGARTLEVASLFIQDLEFEQKEEVLFISMPLRVSKTNIAKERRERLTLSIFPTTPIPLLSWLRSTHVMNGRKTGKLFSTTTSSCNYHYRRVALKLEWPIAPSGHSFRVSYILEAIKGGASDEQIIENCRWRSGEMLSVYRSAQLQLTRFGAPFQVALSMRRTADNERGEPKQENLVNRMPVQDLTRPMAQLTLDMPKPKKVEKIDLTREKPLVQTKIKVVPLGTLSAKIQSKPKKSEAEIKEEDRKTVEYSFTAQKFS
jgi:hypothetical protein